MHRRRPQGLAYDYPEEDSPWSSERDTSSRPVLRRHPYNTPSNKYTIVRTPGHRLVVHYLGKRHHPPRCGDCGETLQGIPGLSHKEMSRLPKNKRTVSRAYGGSRCHTCTRKRILRAFLIEEQRIVKKVMQSKKKKTDNEDKKRKTKKAPKVVKAKSKKQ
ncbi:60s ribosomal protein L34 [Pelomyxa schiedti]|nr:60s ribosomal protein L34 [Pelomyxa schiedti]